MTVPAGPDELVLLDARISSWLADQLAENPVVLAVEAKVDGPYSWFVRLQGDEKDVFTIRFWLQQRTLRYQTHFMPAPEENQAQLYEHLLRRNARLYGACFAIGEEDAVYLQGQLDNTEITVDELDRILGSMYAWVEHFFSPAMRIGFQSKFR